MFRLGAFEVHLLNAGNVMVDVGGAFGLVPRVLWSRYHTPNEQHLIAMCLNCLLIKTQGKHILVDVGMGSKMPPKLVAQWQLSYPHGTLFDGLARLGLTAADIDLVINTHLHADHCENNTRLAADGKVVATFPNAEHVVQRREYKDAMHPNERTAATYIPINYEPLMRAGQMRLLDGDTELLPGVQVVVTPGHTPGHMSVILSAGTEYIFFPCDLATYAVQFEKLAWMTAYDVEPLVTLETKRKWQRWAIETNAIIIFPHDTTTLAARLSTDENDRPQLIALNETNGACYA